MIILFQFGCIIDKINQFRMATIEKLKVVNFHVHSQGGFKVYNIYSRMSKEIIRNPIIGEHCNSTLCYLDLLDVKKNTLLMNFQCEICKSSSQKYVFDIGFKQFLIRCDKIISDTTKIYEVKINPKECTYKIVPSDQGIISHVSNQMGDLLAITVQQQMLYCQPEKSKYSHQKIGKYIRDRMKDIELNRHISDEIQLYSWCRYIPNDTKKSCFLMFFREEQAPAKIQIIFKKQNDKSADYTNDDFISFKEGFSKGQAAYHGNSRTFFVVLPTKKHTYYFAGCLKSVAKMFFLQKRILQMEQIHRQDDPRNYPTVLVDQVKNSLYVLGGFDEEKVVEKPRTIVEFQKLSWDHQFKGNLVSQKLPTLFKQFKADNRQLGGIKIGLRGTNMIRYFTINSYQQKSQKAKSQLVTWQSVGGSYMQIGGLLPTKVVAKKPNVREIEYKIKKQGKVIRNQATSAIIEQEGHLQANLALNYPFILQIPQLGRTDIDKAFVNKVLVFGGHQNPQRIPPQTPVHFFNVITGSTEELKKGTIKFPASSVATYADNHATLLRNQKDEFYLRMTYPGLYSPQKKQPYYVIAQFNLTTGDFKSIQMPLKG